MKRTNKILIITFMMTLFIACNRAYESSWSSNIGDVVQFGRDGSTWSHSTIISYVRPNTGEVFLASHTKSAFNKAYYQYMEHFATSRFICIY